VTKTGKGCTPLCPKLEEVDYVVIRREMTTGFYQEFEYPSRLLMQFEMEASRTVSQVRMVAIWRPSVEWWCGGVEVSWVRVVLLREAIR
jgi:hypothetical protein